MAQMYIRFDAHETNMNLLAYPNVSVHSSVKVPHNSKPQTNLAIYKALKPIVAAHPDWRFVGSNNSSSSSVSTPVLCKFTAYKDDENLGYVSVEYKGRNVKLAISNHRISNEVKRGDSKHTEDPAVAEKLMRKFFYPKLVDERISAATTEVSHLVMSETWAKNRELSKTEELLFNHAADFVKCRMDEYVAAYPAVGKHLPSWKEAHLNMQTVESVKKAIDQNKYVLVILDGSEYIVRSGDEAKVYNNDTLPEELRAKIGMLKLVEPGQMISGVGCKSGATTLLIIGVGESQD